MKVLELDSGNTRLKWRVLDNGQVVARGDIANTENWSAGFRRFSQALSKVEQARASVVSGSYRAESLSFMVKQYWAVNLDIVKIRPQWRGLVLDYDNPMKLGVDRWLAMLAACEQIKQGTRIVVDSGTALTIDLVNGSGQHLGGYIVPGQGLMKDSLLVNTANLGKSGDPIRSIEPGKKTIDCINQGILAMSAALVNAQVERFPDAQVVITGGDAPQLQPYIKAQCQYVSELVMDGLALSLRED